MQQRRTSGCTVHNPTLQYLDLSAFQALTSPSQCSTSHITLSAPARWVGLIQCCKACPSHNPAPTRHGVVQQRPASSFKPYTSLQRSGPDD